MLIWTMSRQKPAIKGIAEMRYAVVSDTREWSEPSGQFAGPSDRVTVADVDYEARRRKNLLHIDEWRMQEYVTGRPLPEDLVSKCRQIDLAAQALARMSPIPHDFADELYWPRLW